MRQSRRAFLASAAAFATPALVRAENERTLRFIPHADLASLDPMWTTADIARNHGNMVYDQLYGFDAAFVPRPQMLAGHATEDDGTTWVLTLRDGLRFHDGAPVLARDCAASIQRWGARDAYGSALLARVNEIATPSDRVIRIRLKHPFPLLPEALAQPTCVVMPERVALTDPNQQITDPTGSGPFRFLAEERLPGSRSVYARFDRYVPRPDGEVSFLAGPRIVHIDRAVWTYQPDFATSAAALNNGEFDWWENPPIDLIGMLRKNTALRVEVKNKMGSIGCMRFNHLFPPFNNVAIRQLVLACVNQETFMQAVAGAEPDLYHVGVGLFTPGMPMASSAGVERFIARTDFDAVKRELYAAGYNGEKIVLMGPTTVFSTHAESLVTEDLLRQMGFNVDYQALEWGTVVQRRASKAPPEKGGWHIFITNLTSLNNVFMPAQIAIRSGPNAWYGWPDAPKLEALREDWLNASTPAEQKRLAAEIQSQFFRDVTYVPLGQFYQPAAFSTRLADIQPGWPVQHAVRFV
jgi:peptide/nickel transport system substrate-binding protein